MFFLTINRWLIRLAKTLAPAVRPDITVRLIGCLLFLTICPDGNLRAQVQSQTGAMLPLSVTILYFDQSSPLLRPGVKTTLDSLAQLLMEQPTLLATVTGYTDNVGKRELNLVLAEYRAKAVAGYMKQRGVGKSRIIVNWEGPARKASTNGMGIKTIDRRVVVQLLPK